MDCFTQRTTLMKWALLLLAIVMCGCEKDTHYDPYYIDYKKGQEYELTFYVSDIHQNSASQIYIDMMSIDNRLGILSIQSNDTLAPRNLTKPDLEETDDLKLYQIADFRFVLGKEGTIEEVYAKTKDWRWVYGQIKDYKFPDGSVHQRIEIVSEI